MTITFWSFSVKMPCSSKLCLAPSTSSSSSSSSTFSKSSRPSSFLFLTNDHKAAVDLRKDKKFPLKNPQNFQVLPHFWYYLFLPSFYPFRSVWKSTQNFQYLSLLHYTQISKPLSLGTKKWKDFFVLVQRVRNIRVYSTAKETNMNGDTHATTL